VATREKKKTVKNKKKLKKDKGLREAFFSFSEREREHNSVEKKRGQVKRERPNLKIHTLLLRFEDQHSRHLSLSWIEEKSMGGPFRRPTEKRGTSGQRVLC